MWRGKWHGSSVTSKSCQMSIKVAQRWLLEKLKILTPLQKLPKNVVELGKLIVATGFKICPKSTKSPNLVTLHGSGKCQKFDKYNSC